MYIADPAVSGATVVNTGLDLCVQGKQEKENCCLKRIPLSAIVKLQKREAIVRKFEIVYSPSLYFLETWLLLKGN